MTTPLTLRLPALLAALCVCALGSASSVDAAQLSASSSSWLSNCAAFGDPYCLAATAQQLPADSAFEPNAVAGQIVQAGTTYTDPRIGTTNATSGTADAGFGVLRAQTVASVSSQPPLGVNQPNLMELTTLASGSFQDSLTIVPQDSALLGQAGTYTASFLVDGQLYAGGANANPGGFRFGYADWRMQIGSGSSIFGETGTQVNGFFGYERFNSNGVTTTGGSATQGSSASPRRSCSELRSHSAPRSRAAPSPSSPLPPRSR